LNWSVFNSFSGKYEAVLYKLCKDYIGVGKTPLMPLEKFRDYMGIREGEYPDFKRLNQWVISGPIKRINESEFSDILIVADPKRENRKIVSLQFFVTPKKQTVMDFGDDPAFHLAKVSVPLGMQREYLASKGSELVELCIQRANEYGEEQEKQGKAVNYGGLYRRAFEENWGEEYRAKKAKEAQKLQAEKERLAKERQEANKERINELKTTFVALATTAAIKALSPEDYQSKVSAYILEKGEDKAKSYDPAKRAFTDPVERTRFNTWLRKGVAPEFNHAAFVTWVKDVKNLDPASLGL